MPDQDQHLSDFINVLSQEQKQAFSWDEMHAYNTKHSVELINSELKALAELFPIKVHESLEDHALFIIDGSHMLHRIKHMVDINPNMYVYTFIKSIINCVQVSGTSKNLKIAVLWDTKGSDYRYSIYDDYKGNRVYDNTVYETDTPEQKREKEIAEKKNQAWFAARTMLHNEGILQSLGFNSIMVEGVEADDIAAYLVHKKSNSETFLVTSDGDWKQLLVSSHVRFIEPIKKYVMSREEWIEESNLTPEYPVEHFLLCKCMMGDGGDNIGGISGIGPVNADKFANRILNKGEFDVEGSSKDEAVYCNLDVIRYNLRLVDARFVLRSLPEVKAEQIEDCFTIEAKTNQLKWFSVAGRIKSQHLPESYQFIQGRIVKGS